MAIMTKDETKKLMTEIDASYPRYFNPETIALTVQIWHETFERAEIEYEFAHKALLEHNAEVNKPPTAADICQRAKTIKRFEFFDKGGRI